MDSKRGLWVIVIAVIATAIIGLQIWASIESTRQVEAVMAEMQQLSSAALGTEKTREDLVKARIENRRATLFWHTLINIMAPMLTAFVAVVGIVTSWRDHLDSRNKERLDRAATDLGKAFERLASEKPLERALGVASLQHFLEADKQSYHLRALSALVTVARAESDEDVLRAVRIAINQAALTIDHQHFRAITWQGVKLRGVTLNDLDLSGADISGAQLQDAKLINANLANCNFEQTKLNGADLQEANLKEVNLTGADLSGSSLCKADLQGAVLADVWVHNLDMDGAKLQGAQLEFDQIPWDQVRHWRCASFDPSVESQLIQRYGPPTQGPKVLMLLWEIPPYVEGGSWTACYHLVRKLRQAGADITIAVPWEDSGENLSPFGVEVNLVYLGIRPPRDVDQGQAHSIYGGSTQYSPYFSRTFSGVRSPSPWDEFVPGPYSSGYGLYNYAYSQASSNRYSIYGARPASIYGGQHSQASRRSRDFFGTYTLYDANAVDSIYPIFGVVQDFARRVVKRLGNHSFDLIHAQDWVTFRAAEELSKYSGKPWVAQFHSTEADRQPNAPHPGIQSLERHAADSATKVVAVSQLTSQRIQSAYQTKPEKLSVVHNPLSPEIIDPLNWGTPETRRVVYLGRFAEQKGTDRFVEVANLIKPTMPAASFVMYGSGQLSSSIQSAAQQGRVQLMGSIDWEQRYQAFRGASVVVVPSRFEPFGMVILEAMLHRVPVIFPSHAGAAEVIAAGFAMDVEKVDVMAETVHALLSDWTEWKKIVDQQVAALETYMNSSPETSLTKDWAMMLKQKH